jgi:hypothetical protein
VVFILNAGRVSFDNLETAIEEIRHLKNTDMDSPVILFDDLHRSFEPSNIISHYIIAEGISCLFSCRPAYIKYTDVKLGNVIISLGDAGQLTEVTGDSIVGRIIESATTNFG